MVGRNQHRISTIIGTKPIITYTITIYNLLHFQAALSEFAPVPASPSLWALPVQGSCTDYVAAIAIAIYSQGWLGDM